MAFKGYKQFWVQALGKGVAGKEKTQLAEDAYSTDDHSKAADRGQYCSCLPGL